MTGEQYIKLGRKTATASFLIGSAIFGFYFLTSGFELLFVGYVYIALAGLINLVIFIAVLLKSTTDHVNKRTLLGTAGLMLLNIPVAIMYCWFAIILINTMRVTFVNATNSTLTNIGISGCSDDRIDELEPGESEIVWIHIPNDCSLRINYISAGKPKSEGVGGYITPGMGHTMIHNIGGENDMNI